MLLKMSCLTVVPILLAMVFLSLANIKCQLEVISKLIVF